MSEKILTREMAPKQFCWDTSVLYPDIAAWENDFSAATQLISQAESFAGSLSKSAQTLSDAIALYVQTIRVVERLGVFAFMKHDEDTTLGTYTALNDRAQSLYVKCDSAWSYLTPELLAIPQADLDAFLAQPSLLEYARFVREIVRAKPYTLDEKSEMLLAMSGEVMGVPTNVYDMLHDADLQFDPITNSVGEELQVTNGRYISLLENEDRQVRKAAFSSLYKGYKNHINAITALLNGRVKKDIFLAQTRKYESTLSMSLFTDDVPVSVYTALIAAIKSKLPILHEYVRLRKQLLGVDELHMYDLYVPMLQGSSHAVDHEQAWSMLMEGVAPIGQEYLRILATAKDGGWIDVYENKGKSSGAYSVACYDAHPFVLMNYSGNIDSVFTLAHEMGHAMHSYYANQTQTFLDAGYSLFVAEVASTVNELLLMNHLIATTQDHEFKLHLINYALEQYRTTVIRQVMFAEFELYVHKMVEDGGALTAENVCEYYLALNKEYFGPDMHVDGEIAYEWARIPHLFMVNPYYVYKYATGFSSAVVISNAIAAGGAKTAQQYVQFLSAGGSQKPLDLLKTVGVDLTTPAPVQGCMESFADMLALLKQLL